MADDQPTCGKGLAENSALPAKLAELTAATADVLEAHKRALNATEENGRREFEAYTRLALKHRDVAARLKATADEMAGYRDLPVAAHDKAVMSDGVQMAAFERVVRAKQELLALLQSTAERDQMILSATRPSRGD